MKIKIVSHLLLENLETDTNSQIELLEKADQEILDIKAFKTHTANAVLILYDDKPEKE